MVGGSRRFQRARGGTGPAPGLVGAEAATGWFAERSTPYRGTQRGLGLGLSGSAYRNGNRGPARGDLRLEING